MSKRYIILTSTSLDKYILKSSSIALQTKECRNYAFKKDWGFELCIFNNFEKAFKDELFFENVLSYCLNPNNNIEIVLLSDINRFIKKGGKKYSQFKEKIDIAGIQIQDVAGTNYSEMDFLERFCKLYEWSKISPSEVDALDSNRESKVHVRNSLMTLLSFEVFEDINSENK